jgi:hypothetical protein
VQLTNAHALGRWDHALNGADAFIAEVEAGAPHYLAPQAYNVRAEIRLAREQTDGVLADAKEAVALARRAKDPQILFRALAAAAHVHAEMGARQIAEKLAGEVLAAVASGQPLGYSVVEVHVLAWTLAEAGRGIELADALSSLRSVPWLRAAIAFATGDPIRAAEICAEIGAVTEEAHARLVAARQLVERRRRAEGDAQVRRALAFYRSVGATRYLREGKSLLAASA